MKCGIFVAVGVSAASCFLTPSTARASSLKYSYGSINVDYQWYTGSRASVSMPVHEFSLHDSSGEFSAALSNVGAQHAAREGAIAEEKRKVREGESLGGPKIINYSWNQAAAQQGDMKEYILRLGSTENIFSLDPITGSGKKKYQSIAELGLIAAVNGDMLGGGEFFALRHDVIFGFRLGLFRDIDKTRPDNDERNIDTAYFYLPLTYRIGLFLPANIRAYVEAGADPITVVRHYGSKSDSKIPLDLYFAPVVEIRLFDLLNVGVKIEEYKGSFISYDKYAIRNPEYKHRMTTAYVSLSDF